MNTKHTLYIFAALLAYGVSTNTFGMNKNEIFTISSIPLLTLTSLHNLIKATMYRGSLNVASRNKDYYGHDDDVIFKPSNANKNVIGQA